MSLKLHGYVDLPAHQQAGGFDHAAVHRDRHLLYIAHTSNHAVDVVDCESDRYMRSIPNLAGVAGALVSEERNLVFTSNRGEDTVSIFSPDAEGNAIKVEVGIHPNGLSFDPKRGLLLAANVGDPDIPHSFTLSIVDVSQQAMIASISVPGRTRWTIFDSRRDVFYVNITNPSQIVMIDAKNPTVIANVFSIPVEGPHGLDLDPANDRLFCACDGAKLVTVDAPSGKVLNQLELSGVPDVLFHNASLKHLYVAVGNPGVIDVFDTSGMQRIEIISTEKGAHTIGFDSSQNKVYAFLPESHRAAIYLDE